ncbi:MAG: hypothetical protein ACLQDF_16455 [Desulfomonilia bacterium]
MKKIIITLFLLLTLVSSALSDEETDLAISQGGCLACGDYYVPKGLINTGKCIACACVNFEGKYINDIMNAYHDDIAERLKKAAKCDRKTASLLLDCAKNLNKSEKEYIGKWVTDKTMELLTAGQLPPFRQWVQSLGISEEDFKKAPGAYYQVYQQEQARQLTQMKGKETTRDFYLEMWKGYLSFVGRQYNEIALQYERHGYLNEAEDIYRTVISDFQDCEGCSKEAEISLQNLLRKKQ